MIFRKMVTVGSSCMLDHLTTRSISGRDSVHFMVALSVLCLFKSKYCTPHIPNYQYDWPTTCILWLLSASYVAPSIGGTWAMITVQHSKENRGSQCCKTFVDTMQHSAAYNILYIVSQIFILTSFCCVNKFSVTSYML